MTTMAVAGRKPIAETFRRLRKTPSFVAGSLLLTVLVTLVLLAPLLTPFNPVKVSPRDRLQPPSAEHPFGTDHFGRDVLARVLHGGRLSLPMGAIPVALEVWKLRESSAKQIARCLDETLVGRIARLEEAKTTLTKRWEDVCKAAGALSDATNKEILGEIEYACRNYGKAVRIAKQEHLDVKDWALAILRRSSVTDFPDKCEYARWVRSVACAAAEGKEKWLEQLENEFCTYIANNAKERAAE